MFITPLKTMDASRTMSPSLSRQHITDMISMHCSKHKGNSAQRFVKFGSSLVTSKHLPCFSAYILVNFSRRRPWVWQECSMQLTTLSDVGEVFHNYFLEEPVVRLDNKTLWPRKWSTCFQSFQKTLVQLLVCQSNTAVISFIYVCISIATKEQRTNSFLCLCRILFLDSE